MQQRRLAETTSIAAPRQSAVAPPATTGFDLDAFLSASTLGTAQAGLAGASSPLPHGEAIQAAFGRHDIGGVRAQIGGPAAAASGSLGATAYAHGDRVAFAEAPDLQLAAHEAAHVVQQRGGVQLQSASGRSGDAYEQHADRVADLVVTGGSAEAELDALAGGASHEVVQRFDSPNHIGVGDSVPGANVKIHGVEFTPGELAALPDYLGDLTSVHAIEDMFTAEQVARMKFLLDNGIEDALEWDKATGGKYSELAQGNETHFAPSAADGGKNFRDEFIRLFGRALAAAQPSDPNTTPAGDDPQLLEYSAEHFLQDAFSAGHQVAAADVARQVDPQIDWRDIAGMGVPIGSRVWSACGDHIAAHYVVRAPGLGIKGRAVDRNHFLMLAEAGALTKGEGGVNDGVRRAVHESLAESHVMVTSQAHPEAFQLLGDRDLGNPEAAEGRKALQLALTEARALLGNATTITNPTAAATALFERHCPVPTASGQQAVRTALETNTESKTAVIDAVVKSMIAEIDDVMGTVEWQTGLVERVVPLDDKKPIPPMDPLAPPADPDDGEVHAY